MFLQLESSLHGEDLLLRNHGEQEAGRGLGAGVGGAQEQELCTRSSLREFLASSGLHTQLGPKPAWSTAKGRP